MAKHFGGMPLVATYDPEGIDGAAIYSGPLHKPAPSSIPVTKAVTSSGSHDYVACAKNSVEWLAHRGAVELGTWASGAGADTCAYARILTHPSGRAKRSDLPQAMRLVRERIQRDGGDAIALTEAHGGALWIPLANAPSYDAVAAWLHQVTEDLLVAHSDLFSTAPLAERGDRFYLGTSSNHPGRFSALPYSATGEPGYTILTPAAWTDLEAAIANPIGAASFEIWWLAKDDLFGALAQTITAMQLPAVPQTGHKKRPMLVWPIDLAIGINRGSNISAAITILKDGKARTSDEIVAAAAKLDLLPAAFPAHQFYVALIEYITRSRGAGRVPQIVQDADRRFRINEPADDWPQPAAWKPRLNAHPRSADLIAALRATGSGTDGTAFEITVVNAFDALGFIAKHVGGEAAPDDLIYAPLASRAYSAVFECKTAQGDVAKPDVAEAAKYREPYETTYAALLGPAFPNEQTFMAEMQTHDVSAWTIDDIAELLTIGADQEEMRTLFQPGFVADRIAAIRWNREHGRAKRVAVICETLLTFGWQAQQHAPNDPENAPLLTEDAAMMLVDGYLASTGAPISCTREDVKAAFAYLTSPLVGKAEPIEQAIVMLSGSP